MMSKQKIIFIISSLLILMFVFSNAQRLIPEEKNFQNYEAALKSYNNNSFSEAYHLLGKVSRFSKIKPAAIYRQALCAEQLSDVKSETKKYNELIRFYPNTPLAIRAKYLKAQQSYEDKKIKIAKREFKEIVVRYPKTDYAIASQYYLGAIEAEKVPAIKNKKKKIKAQKKAVQYFKEYLKIAPTGRFAISSVQKWVNLGYKLNNEDNLFIARIYQQNQDYKNAQKYLQYTNVSVSWPYFVKNAYALKDYQKVKYYTVQGLKGSEAGDILINESANEEEESKNIYEAIDLYLKLSDSPLLSISYLLSISQKASGYDYLLYKNCNNLPVNMQNACYNSLFYKYPSGRFAAESLANIFYSKVKSKDYFTAKKLGRMHLNKFPDANSAPMVMFWMAKIAERTKNYEEARSYYRSLIKRYPDDYYAYRAFLNVNRFRHFRISRLKKVSVKFPYRNSNYALVTELAKVKDYGLINILCKDDKFIQSWLAHLEGDYSRSSSIARDAMEQQKNKPDRTDFRWRLVYPVHYYNYIEKFAANFGNDPILILSIVREESYFNPRAKSYVGARGLMQLMPATAQEAANISKKGILNSQMLFNPELNIELGNVYYAKLRKSLYGKDVLAVLAYNGGIGSVSGWKDSLQYEDVDDFVEQIPYSETKNYLKKVYRSYWNYLRTYTNVDF